MIFDLQRFDTTENTNSITIICGASGELTYDSSFANLTSADIQIRKLARKMDGYEPSVITPTADGKFIATLTLTPDNNGGYTISYNGDGTLKTTNGTISGNTLSGITEDGIVYADKTDNYTAVVCEFDSSASSTHTSYSGNVTSGKKIPTLTIGDWYTGGKNNYADINYDGDGTLKIAYDDTGNAGCVVLSDSAIKNEAAFHGTCSGIVYASETDNYAAAWAPFSFSMF